jgi:hypothetical protein
MQETETSAPSEPTLEGRLNEYAQDAGKACGHPAAPSSAVKATRSGVRLFCAIVGEMQAKDELIAQLIAEVEAIKAKLEEKGDG